MPRVTKAQLEEAEEKLAAAYEDIEGLEGLIADLRDLLNQKHEHQRQTDAQLTVVAHDLDQIQDGISALTDDRDGYVLMVDFYMNVLHTISKYAGQDVEVPVEIAYGAIAPNLVPVEFEDESE